MDHATNNVPQPRASEPESDVTDDGFAPTRFFTGHFASQLATQRKRRQRKIKLVAVLAGTAVATIAVLGLAASIASR